MSKFHLPDNVEQQPERPRVVHERVRPEAPDKVLGLPVALCGAQVWPHPVPVAHPAEGERQGAAPVREADAEAREALSLF